ncbi:hypothetical protein J1N35_023366 [Gossypium stocksii]|uniref:Uncharacterized protein n=1 Tax=Gossypium stocksii TaxID=47602 RepID=A0A9D4A3U5_9ROSI|nr:hypothetical protein J1N35_023366 [Gossypium stocksii]
MTPLCLTSKVPLVQPNFSVAIPSTVAQCWLWRFLISEHRLVGVTTFSIVALAPSLQPSTVEL